jgi:hypothetical protein
MIFETEDEQTAYQLLADAVEPCPMGCGRMTEDVLGGPCEACWDKAPRS